MKEFINTILQQGLEFFNIYYGTYECSVSDVEDPKQLGRIRVKNPALYGTGQSDWAWPIGMLLAGKGKGLFALPAVGDMVYVSFKLGNLQYPKWQYGAWAKGQLPTQATSKYGKVDVLKTSAGLVLEFDNESGTIRVQHPNGMTVEVNEGGISLGTAGGSAHKAVFGDVLQPEITKDANNLAILGQAINAAVVAPGDGGAALKTAMIAAFQAMQNPDYSQINSNKVTLD